MSGKLLDSNARGADEIPSKGTIVTLPIVVTTFTKAKLSLTKDIQFQNLEFRSQLIRSIPSHIYLH